MCAVKCNDSALVAHELRQVSALACTEKQKPMRPLERETCRCLLTFAIADQPQNQLSSTSTNSDDS